MADTPPIDAEDTLDDEMCAPVVNEATGEVRVLVDGLLVRLHPRRGPYRPPRHWGRQSFAYRPARTSADRQHR
ncbi:hypothetical protein ACICHK_02455 [Streptomyces sp. AHU1]|uniref:hypothetical protein n=1 Tax=Streptomyces sp. AHU1 TaxID=3377215 RepID=UPI003877BCC1